MALAGFCFLSVVLAAAGAEKNNPAEAAPKTDEGNEAQQTLRSYLQLQEQLHDTLMIIERSRRETEAAAKASAEAISVRLDAIEKTMGAQQSHEATLLQSSNRVTLITACIFAGLGFLAMIFTAWFLLRAMNRLAAASPLLGGQALVHAHAPMLSPDPNLINLHPVEPASGRLLGVIERLEKRVHELEHTSHGTWSAEPSAQQNGVSHHAEESKALPSAAEKISVILGKGQSLLSLDKPEEAIACFDEAIALDPRHAEALVKKGTALERLKRLEEAIECYDRAITADGAMTLAYLYKGGVCNQLERFGEALECYERALRSQQKKQGPG
jgi:tetratricopeptide (TPR) repeat protein